MALAKEEHYNSTMPQSDLCHLLHNLTDLKYPCGNEVSLMNECFLYLKSQFSHYAKALQVRRVKVLLFCFFL